MADTRTSEEGKRRWVAPDPRQVAELRAEICDYTVSVPAMASMRHAIEAGRTSIFPVVPGLDVSPGSAAALLLARSEADRMNRAALYYATEDMTSLAVAAAQTPPTEVMNFRRLPSPAGFMVFAEPIGGYTEDVGKALAGTLAHVPGVRAEVTTPIVAVSWSVWAPSGVRVMDGPPVRWIWNNRGNPVGIPDEYEGVWLTFYSPRGLFSGLPPETVIGKTRDGSPMLAGQIDNDRSVPGPPLQWDNEMLLTFGAKFEEPEPDTIQEWAQVVYTAWQLMGQEGKSRLTEVEEVPRDRAGRKRDSRAGIADAGAVRIVRVHSAHRPPKEAAEADAAGSTGRRAPQWSCRWPVRPYRRNTCLNPRGHSGGECEHEDRIVPAHIKGPEGKPLRLGDTVHLWDRQPEGEA